MRRKPLVLLALMACLGMGGCSDEDLVVGDFPRISPLDEQVISNCYAVQTAAEAYAAANGGRYPDYVQFHQVRQATERMVGCPPALVWAI
jgi:hypothetical protein